MTLRLLFTLLLACASAHAQVNTPSLAAALATPNVGHIVLETDGTATAYRHGEYKYLPQTATNEDIYIFAGQSNMLTGWVALNFQAAVAARNPGRITTFYNVAVGSTTIAMWQPNGTACVGRTVPCYDGLAAVKPYELKGVRAILWWQGESDIAAGISQASYAASLATLISNVAAIYGKPFVPCKLQNTVFDETAVNSSVDDAWANNPNVKAGPDFHDLTPHNGCPDACDEIHMDSTQFSTVSDRWLAALQAASIVP